MVDPENIKDPFAKECFRLESTIQAIGIIVCDQSIDLHKRIEVIQDIFAQHEEENALRDD